MMKRNFSLALLSVFLFLCSGCDTTVDTIQTEDIVIEAFLFVDEPVENIRITSALSFNSDDMVAAPINDAEVRLIKDDITYPLNSKDLDGYYHYTGEELTVEPGDRFRLEIEYEGQRVTSETEVPPAPVAVALDSTVMLVPTFEVGAGRPPRGGGGGPGNGLLVTWDNSADELHYVVVKGLEDEHEAIFPDFIGQRIGSFRFISSPTRDSFFEVNLGILEGLGAHEVRVYRVNQEYADLYENREQDSRDLNEPPSNVSGALGIFSAFNSVAVLFAVEREN